jgi:hypothetical protein
VTTLITILKCELARVPGSPLAGSAGEGQPQGPVSGRPAGGGEEKHEPVLDACYPVVVAVDAAVAPLPG